MSASCVEHLTVLEKELNYLECLRFDVPCKCETCTTPQQEYCSLREEGKIK